MKDHLEFELFEEPDFGRIYKEDQHVDAKKRMADVFTLNKKSLIQHKIKPSGTRQAKEDTG